MSDVRDDTASGEANGDDAPLLRPLLGQERDEGSPKPPATPQEAVGATPSRSRRRASRLSPWHGQAMLKIYPITQGELWGLGGLGLGATLAFSLAGGMIGFYLDVSRDLDLASGIKPEIVAYWSAVKDVVFWLTSIPLLVGIIFVGLGAINIMRVIGRTEFEE